MDIKDELENRFTYHAPKDGQPQKYEAIHTKAKELACMIVAMVPDSRERSTSITKVDECVFWANAGIARS